MIKVSLHKVYMDPCGLTLHDMPSCNFNGQKYFFLIQSTFGNSKYSSNWCKNHFKQNKAEYVATSDIESHCLAIKCF